MPPTAGLPLRLHDLLPSGRDFGQELAAFLDVPSVQLTCSGTAAQIIALTAFQRLSGRRKVILPAYTCPLVALAVFRCGLTPVLCDLAPDHFDLDHTRLAELCDAETLAIIATHLGGRVANLAPVLEIAARHGAHVIEDAAQSLGARWQGKSVGLVGDAGFYSLAVGKGLTTFEGGVLVAREAAILQRLQSTAAEITPFNWVWELRRSLELLGYALLYRPACLPLAYGLPLRRALKRGQLIEAVGDDFSDDIPLHALGRWRQGIGARALARLPDFLTALNAQAARRLSRLEGIAGVRVMQDAAGGEGTWPFFMVLMPSAEARDAVLTRLWLSGLGVSRLYIHALPDYPYLADRLPQADISNARNFASRMLTISNSPWLDDDGFATICTVLDSCTRSA
ncbi:MAG TPA: DegT/DnrJ/EryC1/StrS family aminotransferase [Methylophilaceae bacterium]|nr:DegT/DnrJ/EryC1/StrS family aminotransferase [Methylophilaceae bacterium]